jgi:acyl-coenzyme A thioesterase PaaI-like protein
MNDLRSDANHCFVCGQANPIGLHLHFELDGDKCRSTFTPGPDHCGYDDVTHGGIIFSALDDVMANWLFLKGLRAYTAKCEIRYQDTLPIGTAVLLESECTRQRRKLAILSSSMRRQDNGGTIATAEASFMVVA